MSIKSRLNAVEKKMNKQKKPANWSVTNPPPKEVVDAFKLVNVLSFFYDHPEAIPQSDDDQFYKDFEITLEWVRSKINWDQSDHGYAFKTAVDLSKFMRVRDKDSAVSAYASLKTMMLGPAGLP